MALLSFSRLRILLILGFSAMPLSASVVLFDNLSAGSPNGYFGVSNTQWAAQSFTTSSTGFILDSVSLRLWNQSGTTGSFEVQIWDSNGTSSRPGTQVGPAIYTGLAEDLGGPGSHLAILGLSVPLSVDTKYYLVVAGTGLEDIFYGFDDIYPGFLAWDATNVITSDSYDTAGSGWNGPYTQNLYMQVTAIPEPTSMFLMMLAGGGLALRRKR